MKKLKFTGLIILFILSITAIGCKSQDKPKTAANNNTVETNRNNTENDTSKKYQNTPEAQKILEANQEEDKEKDNTKIDKSYKEVDKSTLDYNTTSSSSTYCETEDSFVGSNADIAPIDNKKYKEILKDYTYACEVNPTNVTYENAIKLAKSVLPDDIKEIRKKYDSSTTKTYIVYSSRQGNFVLGLAYPYSDTDNFIPSSDKDIVVGIDYMKEILE
ncbi:hypothetical protein psyc5s11_18220 [Clostridium gelidum]|uniref:Lipoprotein n=1 Tax=Clostridium gelidum TaxID=704125 RepID=A0ABM7T1G7_9CLOT|nr:hypothetical protein [Clostridium gelidum]BCZ45755.1 hypothetical protein psyc5s11_18220 [Clostridium gelidum]